MKNILKILIGVVIIVGLYLGFRTDKVDTNEPLKIGALYTLTGPLAAYGEFQKQSAELAVKNINDAGGINGQPVELLIEDTASDAKKGLDAYQALKTRGVKFFAVEYSPVAAAVRPVAIADGNFIISSGATTPAFIDNNTLSCRTTMTAKDIGPALAQQLINSNIKTAALLMPNNEFGKGIFDEFTKAYVALGGTVTASELFDAATSDFRTNITKLKTVMSTTGALITVNAVNTAQTMLQQISNLGWNKPIYSDYNTIQNPVIQDKKLANGIVFVDWNYQSEPSNSDTPNVKAYKQAYLEQFGTNPSLPAAAYYDGVKLALDAIKIVGESPQEVGNYISNLTDYPLITGKAKSFDSDCQAQREYQIRKVENGLFVTI